MPKGDHKLLWSEQIPAGTSAILVTQVLPNKQQSITAASRQEETESVPYLTPYISEAIPELVSGFRSHRKDHLLRDCFANLSCSKRHTDSLLLWGDGGAQTLSGTTCWVELSRGACRNKLLLDAGYATGPREQPRWHTTDPILFTFVTSAAQDTARAPGYHMGNSDVSCREILGRWPHKLPDSDGK